MTNVKKHSNFKEDKDNKNKTAYRMVLSIPIELELESRKKAYDIGFVRADKGILSNYIQFLIINDLKERKSLRRIKSVDYGEINRVNITIDPSLKKDMVDRAKELGIMKGAKGNISGYIRYLLAAE